MTGLQENIPECSDLLRLCLQVGEKIVMAPSGVQKERMQKADMFVLDAAGNTLETPLALPPPAKPPKLSECSPLFMSVSLSSAQMQASEAMNCKPGSLLWCSAGHQIQPKQCQEGR